MGLFQFMEQTGLIKKAEGGNFLKLLYAIKYFGDILCQFAICVKKK
jgi:hypothetical protein